MLYVFFKERSLQRVDCGRYGLCLVEDVDTIFSSLNHFLYAVQLAFDSLDSGDFFCMVGVIHCAHMKKGRTYANIAPMA